MVLADIFQKYCIKKQTVICKHEVNKHVKNSHIEKKFLNALSF